MKPSRVEGVLLNDGVQGFRGFSFAGAFITGSLLVMQVSDEEGPCKLRP